MRLEQLQYIVETAKQKSISKAAKNLYLSQPSLSKAISQLETELGFSIFVRLQQGVIPTTKGEIIIAKAQTILKEIEDIKNTTIDDVSTLCATTFNVALPLLLCNEIFTQVSETLQKQFPSLTIITYQYNTMDTINDLRNGVLDVGIISYSSTEKEHIEQIIKAEKFFMQTFAHEKFYIVTHASSHWSQYQAIPSEALTTAQIITFSDILRFGNIDSFQPELAASNYVSNKEVLFSILSKQKEAVTIFPRSGALMNAALYAGEFIAIPIIDIPNTQYVSGIFNSNKALPLHAQSFIDILADFYQQFAEK